VWSFYVELVDLNVSKPAVQKFREIRHLYGSVLTTHFSNLDQFIVLLSFLRQERGSKGILDSSVVSLSLLLLSVLTLG